MTIDDLVNGIDCVLFDVDGPICSIFAGVPAPRVATLLRTRLRNDAMPDHIAHTSDPLSVLAYAASTGQAEEVENTLTEAENRATETAEPTPGADAALFAARRSGHVIGFVSNNSAVAVARYLAAHGLIQPGDLVSARTAATVDQMKPDPSYVRRVLDARHIESRRAVLVGDSDSDMTAARASGTRAIGYANKPGKADRLQNAGADHVIDSMHILARALDRSRLDPTASG